MTAAVELARSYWRGLLGDVESANELPCDRRATGAGGEAPLGELELELPEAETARLREVCRTRRWTLSTLLQGAWAVLLGRYSRQDEVVFGTTAGGCTLPVRASVGGDGPVSALLDGLQAQMLESQRYGYAPLAEMQAQSGVGPGEPLFHSLLVLDLDDPAALERTSYPLVLISAAGERLHLRVEYDGRLFDAETVERMAGHLRVVLGAMASEPEMAVRELPILTEEELEQLGDRARIETEQAER